MEISFTGYQGNLLHTGSGDYFNINNLSNDDVTITFTGDNRLTVSGGTTRVTIIDNSTGNIEVDNQLVDLVESGLTGQMADGEFYDYTIISIGNKSYILLDDHPDPDFPLENPFYQTLNPISSDPSTDPHPICFVGGTRILTSNGEVEVEELQTGDRVLTRESGEQVICWTASRELSGTTAKAFAPIRISADAFGNGLPARDLLVSPQHRILITDWRAELLFGVPEVLVAAKHLVNDHTVCVETDLDAFSYHHILFEKHETVFSEGLPTESFHPGDMAMSALGEAARLELLELFPELADAKVGLRPLSHRALKCFEARAFTAI